MRGLFVVTFAAMLHGGYASISASRDIQKLVGVELKVDIDGCTATDKYGCKSYSTDFGKTISGNVHVKGSVNIQAGSSIKIVAKIHTGILPVPFEATCPLCNGKCAIHIPIVGKEIDIPLPPCPIKLSEKEINQKFSEMIPTPPSPFDELHGSVDGTATVTNEKGEVIAVVKFSASDTKSHLKPVLDIM